MKKCRILCLCLVMVMLISALPFAASAASNMPIKVGDTKTIVIEEKGGYLLFDFTPEKTGTYVFWSSDNESKSGNYYDTYGEVYVGGEMVAHNDDGANNNNFRVEMHMVAGTTYTLKARAYSSERLGSMKVHLDELVQATKMIVFDAWTTTEMNVGTYSDPGADFYPVNAAREEFTLKSSNSDVILVEDDELFAVGAGTATITAVSENGLKDSIKLTVLPTQNIKVNQKVTVSPYNPTAPTFKFKAPADAVYTVICEDGGVWGDIYDSEMDYLAYIGTATETTSIGTFQASKGETCYISLSHYPQNGKGTYTVTIKEMVDGGTVRAEHKTYIGYPGISIDPDFLPEPLNANVSWYIDTMDSSNPEVAKFEYGSIFCVAPGTATITATTDDNFSFTFKVEVREPKKLTKTGTFKFTSTTKEEVAVYEFTPKTSGVYCLEPQDFYGYIWCLDDGDPLEGVELTAGEKFYFAVEGTTDKECAFNLYKEGEIPCHAKGHKFDGYSGFVGTTLTEGYSMVRCSVCGACDYKWNDQLDIKKSAEKQFKDVKKKDWFFSAVNYAFNSNLFNGTAATEFSPNDNMTRGMFVTVLGRLSGVAENKKATTKFTDVAKGQYYAGYVKWANDNGIVDGVSATRFAPEENITREQICVMMERFMKHNDLGMRNDFEVVKFKDEAKISKWAKSAVLHCQAGGIVNGQKGEGGMVFNPQGNATRAEVATILYNFNKNYVSVYNYMF